jgi:hypothetical protein
MCGACYAAWRAKQQQAQGLSCSGCGREGLLLTCGMCNSCYQADRAKQQQAQGMSCSGCRREGLLIVSNGLCKNCIRKLKALATQRAAIEEYTAAKAEQASKAKEAQQRVLYL